jgi:hypothetical protein
MPQAAGTHRPSPNTPAAELVAPEVAPPTLRRPRSGNRRPRSYSHVAHRLELPSADVDVAAVAAPTVAGEPANTNNQVAPASLTFAAAVAGAPASPRAEVAVVVAEAAVVAETAVVPTTAAVEDAPATPEQSLACPEAEPALDDAALGDLFFEAGRLKGIAEKPGTAPGLAFSLADKAHQKAKLAAGAVGRKGPDEKLEERFKAGFSAGYHTLKRKAAF